MSASGADKRHLIPLLEFLRFVSARGKNAKSRFPKKINGAAELGRESFYEDYEQDSLTQSPDYMFDFTRESSQSDSPSQMQDGGYNYATALERRKRLRSPETTTPEDSETPSVPIECEVVSKTPGKGCFTSKYVDFSLSDLGLQHLVDVEEQHFTKDIARAIQGLQCCYLRLGTSMVVTGDIIDVSFTGEAVLVSPDRGLRVDLEWVPLKRVFQVPHNINEVREVAAARVERIIEAERNGEKTPRLSPVQLAKNPATALFPASPEAPEK